jgi:hypothetical protein
MTLILLDEAIQPARRLARRMERPTPGRMFTFVAAGARVSATRGPG